jgi:hypothetical protein
MTTPNPDNLAPTVEELSAQLATLRATLAKSLGLGEDADEAAILARVADTTKEAEEAKARAADVESRWASEKVDSALRDAFAKSGADAHNAEDFLALARPLFTVDAKTGAVVTKTDAPNTVPGQNAEAWIVSELRAKRSHWWPKSQGAGARGGGALPSGGADDSCFDPSSPNYNFTKQLAAEAKYGAEFADKARARYRGRGR